MSVMLRPKDAAGDVNAGTDKVLDDTMGNTDGTTLVKGDATFRI